jgi:hypothetical protein
MPQVRAIARAQLVELQPVLARVSRESEDMALWALIAADVQRFLAREWQPQERRPTPTPPPGAPIGHDEEEWD